MPGVKLQLELGDLLGAVRGGPSTYLDMLLIRAWCGRSRRALCAVDHRAGRRLDHRRRSAPRRTTWAVRLGNALCRAVPQHPAAGPDVPLVLRDAGVPPAGDGRLRSSRCRPAVGVVRAGACSASALFTVGARRRAGARRASRRCRAASRWPARRSGLTLPQTYRYRAAADGVPDHPAAADLARR